MTIQISDMCVSNNYKGCVFNIDGKEIMVSRHQFTVGILCNNASHRAWRGMGKYWQSFEAARPNYKSAAVQMAISEFIEWEKAGYPVEASK